ncbi:MAG: FkbM family methyltransferase, partial [Prevotellaceae bacterium]|nr:FkbM family methyltransferase [Prevotellaceae bacterium]
MENVVRNDPLLEEKYTFFSNNPYDAEYFMQYIYGFICDKGDHVIDVGAHSAIHTIPLSTFVGGRGSVYSFEAIPYLCNRLNKLYKNKYIFHDNVKVFNVALTNYDIAAKNKFIDFNHVCDLEGYSGIVLRPDAKSCKIEKINVQCAALDNIIQVNNTIKFIKIDVEGGDFDVLRGARRILSTSKSVVIFESGRQYAADMYSYSKSDFFEFFEELGYELFTYTGERFTEDMWDSRYCYWETWAIHRESPYLKFFSEK